MEDTKGRYRLFSIIVYEDSESYNINDILFNIKSQKYYAYIIHNKDKDKKGLILKNHYHIIIRLENASTIDALSKKLGVPSNYIQRIKNERAYIRYLIHFDNQEKYQYQLEDIMCSRYYQRKIMKAFEDLETEEDIIIKIYDKIDKLNSLKLDKRESIFQLIQFVNVNCYDTIYKRYRQEFLNLLY